MDRVIWSGKTTSYHHNSGNDTKNPTDTNAGFRKVWYLDAKYSTCPIEVEAQVSDLWSMHELGNDNYIFKTSINDLNVIEDGKFEVKDWDNVQREWTKYVVKTNAIVQWIKEQAPEIDNDELIIIHWWW